MQIQVWSCLGLLKFIRRYEKPDNSSWKENHFQKKFSNGSSDTQSFLANSKNDAHNDDFSEQSYPLIV